MILLTMSSLWSNENFCLLLISSAGADLMSRLCIHLVQDWLSEPVDLIWLAKLLVYEMLHGAMYWHGVLLLVCERGVEKSVADEFRVGEEGRTSSVPEVVSSTWSNLLLCSIIISLVCHVKQKCYPHKFYLGFTEWQSTIYIVHST
mgnify:CR=1 FL=1